MAMENEACYNSQNIEDIIPTNWKFKICRQIAHGKSPKKLELTLKVALFSESDIKSWIRALEQRTQCAYSIRSTEKCAGEKVSFKQRLNCRHNTRCKSTFNSSLKTRTRNTKCPSYLNVTLQCVRKAYRGSSCNPPDPDMPCVVVFVPNHNHDIVPAEALKYKRICRENLLNLSNFDHSYAALENVTVENQYNNCALDSHEHAMEECQQVTNELFNNFDMFLKQSPAEVLPALRTMVERTKELKTVNAFVSSCTAFSTSNASDLI